jgi:dihydrofolate reductase
VSATYTFDVFATLDGFGSYGPDGDWGGYWGKQGPEFHDRRLAVMSEDQRLVLGATTFREFVQLLGPSAEESGIDDPVNNRLRTMPTTVVSKTLTGPFAWPDATLENGDAVDVVARLKEESETPLRSHGSLSMNRSLMAAGLVDRVQLTIFPVISGRTGTNRVHTMVPPAASRAGTAATVVRMSSSGTLPKMPQSSRRSAGTAPRWAVVVPASPHTTAIVGERPPPRALCHCSQSVTPTGWRPCWMPCPSAAWMKSI